MKNSEDLKIKVGTKDEVFWTGIKNKCEEGIVNAKREIVINGHVIKLATEKIVEEQKHLNTKAS